MNKLFSDNQASFGYLVPAGSSSHFPLRGRVVLIGRSRSACGLSLPYRDVSRRHCLLTREVDGVYLEDLESTNGTLVNGESVRRRLVGNGEHVQIGQHLFRLKLGSASSEETCLQRKMSTHRRRTGNFASERVNEERRAQPTNRQNETELQPNVFRMGSAFRMWLCLMAVLFWIWWIC